MAVSPIQLKLLLVDTGRQQDQIAVGRKHPAPPCCWGGESSMKRVNIQLYVSRESARIVGALATWCVKAAVCESSDQKVRPKVEVRCSYAYRPENAPIPAMRGGKCGQTGGAGSVVVPEVLLPPQQHRLDPTNLGCDPCGAHMTHLLVNNATCRCAMSSRGSGDRSSSEPGKHEKRGGIVTLSFNTLTSSRSLVVVTLVQRMGKRWANVNVSISSTHAVHLSASFISLRGLCKCHHTHIHT